MPNTNSGTLPLDPTDRSSSTRTRISAWTAERLPPTVVSSKYGLVARSLNKDGSSTVFGRLATVSLVSFSELVRGVADQTDQCLDVQVGSLPSDQANYPNQGVLQTYACYPGWQQQTFHTL
jgi:hypothetical protein